MDAKKCEKIYDKLYENLTIVFNSKEILMQLSNENFKDLILNQVSILNYLENELPSSVLLKKSSKSKNAEPRNDAKSFLDKLNTILSSNKDFLNLNFTKESDIEDEVNYLPVYIKNTFKKNLNEFKKNVTDKPESVKAQFTEPLPNSSNANTSNSTFANNNNFNQGFGNPFFGGFNGYNADPRFIQEQVYLQMADQRLKQDINAGTFYMFKNKPKIIPILKKVMGGFAIAYSILFLIGLIMCSVCSPYLQIPWSYYPTYGGSQGELESLSVVNNGLILFPQIILIIITLFFAYQMLVPRKNENLVYSFSWTNFAFVVIWSILSIWNTATSLKVSYSSISYLYGEGFTNQAGNDGYIAPFSVSVYLQISAYVILGLMVIIAIVTAVMSPKRDIERIQLKMQEYIAEIKKVSSNASA